MEAYCAEPNKLSEPNQSIQNAHYRVPLPYDVSTIDNGLSLQYVRNIAPNEYSK
jgi:hypothetical protein